MTTSKHKKYHQNKTYKIYPLYNIAFDSCLYLYKRDVMSSFLLENHFDIECINSIPSLTKFEVFELILVKLISSEHEISDLLDRLHNDRMKEFKQILIDSNVRWNGARIPLNVRINPYTKDTISKLSKHTGTIGGVIELAIANFIYTCPDSHYEFILFIFKKLAEQHKNK